MLQLLQSLSGVCAEYKKVRADIKKRTAEAQRWQKKAKKIRSGMAGGNGGMMGQNPNGNGGGGNSRIRPCGRHQPRFSVDLIRFDQSELVLCLERMNQISHRNAPSTQL